jgi:hypothetical protein
LDQDLFFRVGGTAFRRSQDRPVALINIKLPLAEFAQPAASIRLAQQKAPDDAGARFLSWGKASSAP